MSENPGCSSSNDLAGVSTSSLAEDQTSNHDTVNTQKSLNFMPDSDYENENEEYLEDLLREFEDFDEDEFDDGDFDIIDRPEVPLFPQNPLEHDKLCDICYDITTVRKRLCCDTQFCDLCIDIYLNDRVSEGVVKIPCPAECDSYFYRDEILARLPIEMKEKYYKFLIDANKDPYVKTCPRCSHVKKVTKGQLDDKLVRKRGLEVICEKCDLHWCFPCHSPWHPEMTCKEYRKGDRLVQIWAHQMNHGQLNAQRCPHCKTFIQRTSGCDHMTCSSCHTSFCYRCGKRYRSLKMFGNHFSRFSPFGCKYNLLPNRPHTRKFVRGALFGTKLLGSAVIASLALAVGAVLVGTSVVVVPAYLGYRYNKRRKARRRAKQTVRIPYYTDFQMRLDGPLNNTNPLSLGIDLEREFEGENTAETYMNNWVMVSRRNDAQQVEVLVHRTLGPAPPKPETSNSSTSDDLESNPSENVVTVTNITEEISEEGYTRVVAHIIARNKEGDISSQDANKTRKMSKESSSSSSRSDFDQKSSKESSQELEPETIDLELAGETNGCFVNIFSKKLNSWQVHNTLPAPSVSAKAALKAKSGTWEKSGKKLSNPNSLDIRTFSNLLSSQSEKDVKSCDTTEVPECSSSQDDTFTLPRDYVTYL